MGYVLSSYGLFSVQFVCSFSRIARYTPSLADKLTSKDSANECNENLFSIAECSLSYAKIVQTSAMKLVFNCRVQPILCKIVS